MKIHIITGASGFVGRNLVKSLCERGEKVWIVMRSQNGMTAEERAEKLFPSYVKNHHAFCVIEGDIMKENLGINNRLLQKLSGQTVWLWHLAANLSFATKEKENSKRTNHIGTINVVNLANRIAKRYMHVSTAYVCGDQLIYREDDLDMKQRFRNHYESSKFEAEKHVKEHCKISYIVFRPSIIIGDAYKGKAEGCTFGYYRFAFMFFIFKKWVVKTLEKKTLLSSFLRTIGTTYNKRNDMLIAPWLVLIYPKGGTVDMIPLDYVVGSMLTISEKIKHRPNKTFHLVHYRPPKFEFLLKSLLEDFGLRKLKYVQVSAFTFTTILQLFYVLFYPIRRYTKSIFWYLPYFIGTYQFDRSNCQALGIRSPPEITRNFIKKINTYAQDSIFKDSNIKTVL